MSLVKVLVLIALPLGVLFAELRQAGSTAQIDRNMSLDREASLLESGTPAKLLKVGPTNGEIKVVSYNIRYRSGDDLKQLIKLFREDPEIGNAVIIGLQEVDRKKKRTGNINTAKIMSDELQMNYAWAAPPTAKPTDEEETGVTILSPFPISDIRRMVLPHEGPNGRRRVALGATIRVQGIDLRVYSMHGETRIGMDKKMEQMGTLLQDLKTYPEHMPAIIVGDLNTWESNAARKTIKLFSDFGLKTPFGSQKTFCRKALFIPIEFRLDWIWLRGVEALTYGIDRQIKLSDHYPLWTNVKLPTAKEPQP
jgi:endonuclease/exonuclease/phosphatase family metal-dependent hydrolase